MLSTVSHVTTLVFIVVLIVMFAVRLVPQQTTLGFYPRCAAVAGTFLGVGIVLLTPKELSLALYLASLLLIIGSLVFAIWAGLVLGRSISILPEARRLVTSGPYCPGPLSTLSWRVRCYGWSCAAVPVDMGTLGLQFAFQLQRMKNEERVLFRVFPEYGDYMARTARLVPGVY